jgi:hypothetical protein
MVMKLIRRVLVVAIAAQACADPMAAPDLQVATTCFRTVNVVNVTGLRSAIANAAPGDCINVAPGTYNMGAVNLTVNRGGQAAKPITIRGGGASNTIINMGVPANIIFTADYVHVRKLRFTNIGNMGFWMAGAHHNVLDSVEIDHSQQQLIALKEYSYQNVIKNSRFHDSGLKWPQYGEGVYVGGRRSDGSAMRGVFRNQILNNRFSPNVRADAVDIKGLADSTIVRGNFIDGTGTRWMPENGLATLISIVSNHNTIDGNYLRYGNPNGIMFYAWSGQTMAGNLVTNNTIDLRNIHNVTFTAHGIGLTRNTLPTRTIVKCSNVVTNGVFSNVSCTP